MKLGFVFPSDATILRKELHEKIMQQNLAAAREGGADLLDVDFDINVPTQPGPQD